MDLRAEIPALNVYNRSWRIRTAQRDYPPARIVRHRDDPPAEVLDSLVCEGSVILSANLRRVVLGYDCIVHTGSEILLQVDGVPVDRAQATLWRSRVAKYDAAEKTALNELLDRLA